MLWPRLIPRAFAVAALMATCAASSPVHAQDDPADLFRQGQEAYSKGDVKTAYDKYKAAWALKRSYDIAGNLGNVEVKLGRYREAVPHLQFVLANLPVSMDSETREAVTKRTEDLLADAKAHVAIVKFSVTPPEATIRVDGAAVEQNVAVLEPGSHKLELEAEGYDKVDQTLELAAGTTENTVIAMAKSGSGSTADISSSKGDAAADDGPSLPLIIVGGVVGLGAVGAGIALHVVAAGKGSDADTIRETLADNACRDPVDAEYTDACSDLDSLISQQSTFSGAGTGLLIGGGVVLAATAVYWLWPRGGDEPSATAVTLLPSFGPGFTGLVASGSF
ncbi:MAG: PEGA domain-containing protein [Myxococcales bacterium]|nr:PEGA domain-containing protein [Myxococcales bacterium]